MDKLNKVEYNPKDFNLDNLLNTKYDNLFEYKILINGSGYYVSNRVTKFHKDKNRISAVIKGTNDYNVSVDFKDDNSLIVKCECKYHKDMNQYCKHVYSLLLYFKMIDEKRRLVNCYNSNIKRTKEILDSMEKMIIDNKTYLRSYYSWTLKIKKYYEKKLREVEEKFDKDNIFKLTGATKDSYYNLNDTINCYNKIVDYIEEGIVKKQKEETLDEGFEYVFDDSYIYDKLDKISNDIDELERNIEELNNAKKDNEKKIKKTVLFGSLYKLFSNSKSKDSSDTDYLMPWEQELVDRGEYDPENFEEEELEEDDYYYDDD